MLCSYLFIVLVWKNMKCKLYTWLSQVTNLFCKIVSNSYILRESFETLLD